MNTGNTTMNMSKRFGFLGLFALMSTALAQGPRIAALYPAGAQAGQSVEVAIRGGGLAGAKRVVVSGAPGIKAELVGGSGAVDEGIRPLFNAKCVTCHESRSPDNRTMSPEQWASTVDRMINARGADIKKEDRDKVVGWLQAKARAGQITAKLSVAPDAAPGLREVRLVTELGVSSPFSFEVSGLPEQLALPNASVNITLPAIVNGALTQSGQRDRFVFSAKKGEAITFNLKAYRINEQCPMFFNPVLYLYDSKGKERAKSLGKLDIDPILEWICPDDGEYTLVVRDLLWKGNPASIYRLVMGNLPTDTTLPSMVARPGSSISALMGNLPVEARVAREAAGVTMVPTPLGDTPVLVRDLPDGGGPVETIGLATPVTLPAMFSGKLLNEGQVDRFRVRALKPGMGIEFYTKRLGSPLRPRVTIKDEKEVIVQTRTMDGDDELRMTGCFPKEGEYTVEVRDALASGGAYCWETIGAGVADFALTVTPDGANLAPGRRAALLVRATRREALQEPIELTIKGLPSGVRAEVGVIPPDDDKALVLITVDDKAELGGGTITIEGSTKLTDSQGNVRTLTRMARPIELYRTQNNNLRPAERNSAYIGVARDEPPFGLSVQGIESLDLGPGKSATVTIKIARPVNGRSDVIISPLGLPPGVTINQGAIYVPGNQNEVSFTLRGSDGSRYLGTRDAKLPPLKLVFVGTTGGRNADAPTDSTAPIVITAPREGGIKIGR